MDFRATNGMITSGSFEDNDAVMTESDKARRRHEHYKVLADLQIRNIIHTLMSVSNMQKRSSSIGQGLVT